MPEEVRILYTNYRGSTEWRTILPSAIRFGSNEWHPTPQWLLDAEDTQRGEHRTFAMADIHEWKGDREDDVPH